MVASAVSNLKINNHVSTTNSHEAESNTKAYLEVVANEVEITHQVREKLKKLECQLFLLDNVKNDKNMLKIKSLN